MINTAMFQKIVDQIEAHPELHNQEDYTNETQCGTAHCVAGWAVFLWGEENGIEPSPYNQLALDALAKKYGSTTWGDSFEGGRRVLGLTGVQASALFYNMDNDDALRMAKEYAAGGRPVSQYAEPDCDCGCRD